MKKIMTLIIGVSLLFPSGALFAKEKQGVQLVITKTDGTKIEGELIAIKQNSTLILESPSVIGGSIDVSEVKIIKIVEKSKILLGTGLGFLAGAGAGALTGLIACNVIWGDFASNDTKGQGRWAGVGGAIGGLVGALIGAVANSGHKETILIRGKSQEEIKAVLEKLRKKARFPDYQ